MDEKLKSTIDKIVRLCSQEPEFANELRKRLGIDSSTVSETNSKLKNVEKYLGLDYYIDSQHSTIDYSYIKKTDVKAQLISDNREMMRFRYGTRYHQIDFDEFCRYAHLQAEMLFNYYYDTLNNSDFAAIKTHIKHYNSKASIDTAKTLADISFNVKLWAFNYEYKKQIDLALFDNLRKVRNELSHRSPENDSLEITKYQKYLRDMGLKVNKTGYLVINWNNRDAESEKKAIGIKNSDDYKQYEFMIWYHSKNYDTIIENLATLSNVIRESLHNV